MSRFGPESIVWAETWSKSIHIGPSSCTNHWKPSNIFKKHQKQLNTFFLSPIQWPICFWGCVFRKCCSPKGWPTNLQKWVCLAGKILFSLPRVFCPIVDPPNAHIKQHPKFYRELITRKILLYIFVSPSLQFPISSQAIPYLFRIQIAFANGLPAMVHCSYGPNKEMPTPCP